MARKKIREYDSKRCGKRGEGSGAGEPPAAIWWMRRGPAQQQQAAARRTPYASPAAGTPPARRRLLKAHIARLAGLQLPIHVAQVKEATNFSELVSGALLRFQMLQRSRELGPSCS